MSNLNQGHRERLKEEFRKFGFEGFAPHKALELMLFYAIPRKDTNHIAHLLIEKFGSFSGVINAPVELLEKVDGIGSGAAVYIKMISAVIKLYMEDSARLDSMITSHDSAKKYMQYKFLTEQFECFYLACLGNNGKVLYCEKIFEGSPESVDIVLKEVIKTALRADAVKVIVAHNHPHGICNPSSKDLFTTHTLYEELKRVDVELIDHIIVANDGIYSMSEHNMLP